jgi:hypothetical protein
MTRNDNGDYHDRDENSIQVQSTMLCTMKSELWERSSNTNSCLIVVELEALFTSQVRIMKYVMGTPDYPSGIPDMHIIHDLMISVS